MKAILVIDYMPSVCTECPFYEWVDDDNWESEEIMCGIRCGLGTFNFKDEKPSWCPLKPMSEKRELHQYVGDRCYHCRFFNGEKSSVGIACTNPIKEWRTRTAKYKQPSMKACKMFERKQEE